MLQAIAKTACFGAENLLFSFTTDMLQWRQVAERPPHFRCTTSHVPAHGLRQIVRCGVPPIQPIFWPPRKRLRQTSRHRTVLKKGGEHLSPRLQCRLATHIASWNFQQRQHLSRIDNFPAMFGIVQSDAQSPPTILLPAITSLPRSGWRVRAPGSSS